MKPAVSIAEDVKTTDKKAMERRCQTHFHLAHYTDALFRSHEERLNSNEWQAAMRLRKHKVPNSLIQIKRLRKSKDNRVLSDINCCYNIMIMILLFLQTVELEALIKRLRSSTKVVTEFFSCLHSLLTFSGAVTRVAHNIGGEN